MCIRDSNKKPLSPMGRVVFATEPSARYANGFQQQPYGKHDYPNSIHETEAIGGLPNCLTAQRNDTRFS